jgi:hypothetical protein
MIAYRTPPIQLIRLFCLVCLETIPVSTVDKAHRFQHVLTSGTAVLIYHGTRSATVYLPY